MDTLMRPGPQALVSMLQRAVDLRSEAGWDKTKLATDALAALSTALPTWNLDDVARHFSLNVAEQCIVEVGLLAEGSVAGHLLLGLLSGDDGPARPTVALVLELAGVAPVAAEAIRLLGPTSTLRRGGLVGIRGDDVLLARRVVLPERVLAHAAGIDEVPSHLKRILLDQPALAVDGADLLARALAFGHQLVWIHTPPNAAGVALATSACGLAHVGCLAADLARVPVGVDPAGHLADLLLECGIRGTVLILAGSERIDVELLTQAPVPVLAVSSEPWDANWARELPITVHAPRLSVDDRRQLWAPIIGHLDGTQEHQMLAAMPLSPQQISTASRHAREVASLLEESEVSAARIQTSLRQLGRDRTRRANTESSATIDDLVLPPHARDEVARLIDWVRYRGDIIASGRAHGKGGKGTGIAGLFSGPPGTGKTMAAHVVADTLGMDLLQVQVATVVDKYIGETEKNLEKVFAEAESMHAVLFFDEADALFGSRSAVKDAKDRYANQEISYLLQRIEQFDGITILATNLRGNMDPAFLRRLHFAISFPEPDEATRLVLWQRLLAELDESDANDPPDLERLASHVELAGGEMRNIVLSAAYAAVAENGGGAVHVGMRHLVRAVEREYLKLGRRAPSL